MLGLRVWHKTFSTQWLTSKATSFGPPISPPDWVDPADSRALVVVNR
jgi:hypothetical protein